MYTRFRKAVDKFLFCWRNASFPVSFFQLIWFTKKWNRTRDRVSYDKIGLVPIGYQLKWRSPGNLLYLRTNAGDLDVFYEVFWLRAYGYHRIDFAKVNTIVDLGAHVGMASLFFLRQNPSAIVYSIEPEKDNYDLLLKNLNTEVINKRAYPLKLAISNYEGKVKISKGQHHYNNRISSVGEEGESVDTLSLNVLIRQLGLKTIDLLKIDIEGAERLLFSDKLEWMQYVNRMIIETHSATDKEVCLHALKSHGFEVEAMTNIHAGGNLLYSWRP